MNLKIGSKPSKVRKLYSIETINRLAFITLFFLSACATDTPIRHGTDRFLPESIENNLNVTRPFQTTRNPDRNRVMREAKAQIGKPYRFGGEFPENGFDCSGLVSFTHRRAGIRVPRTSREQLSESNKVVLEKIQPGDLVFFKLNSKVSHVGIYVGGRQFIHASSRGKKVKTDMLTLPYWVEHFVAAGHFYR
ncbi:MAG: C40 family peptidase [Methylococcales bacterium]